MIKEIDVEYIRKIYNELIAKIKFFPGISSLNIMKPIGAAVCSNAIT